jgi:glyoxylase-like metal-dependent hydrolase (beta-lactamase superfamily II)
MRIHHLNCASFCPACGWLFAPRAESSSLWQHMTATHTMVCHCLLIEARHGLVLVDTGLGTRDLAERASLGMAFNLNLRPAYRAQETALAQVRTLGFQASDVRDIVVTHLDLDHAGGMADFPDARVHVMAAEHKAAHRPSWREKLQMRYVPEQWAHGPHWQKHEANGDTWLGFHGVRAIPELEDELLLIPLPGHTRGHTAVAVRQQSPDKPDWLLHCGDAYFSHLEMATPRRCPPGLRLLQTLVEIDREKRLGNQARLRELATTQGENVSLFCAHDPLELARHQAVC